MFRALSAAARALRPRLSGALSLIVVLTITSACMIAVTTRQHALLKQRVHFFLLMHALEVSVGDLHGIADAGRARRNELPAVTERAGRQLQAIRAETQSFDAIRPRIVDELGRAQRLLASPSLFAATNGSLVHLHLIQEIAGEFYAQRMQRYGILSGALAALLSGACTLLLVLELRGRKSKRLIDRLDHDLRALMDSAPMVMLAVSKRGTVLRWNERLARLTGMRSVGPVTALIPPWYWPMLDEALAQARAQGESECDIPLLTAAGKESEIAWVCFAAGGEVTMAGRDISDRVAAQRDLVRAAARHAQLFEQIRDAALITQYGSVVDINSAGLELFGYSREEMASVPLVKLLDDPADIGRCMRALRAGPVVDFELRLRTRDGRTLDCLITAAARFDAAGNLIGCQGLARDVTDRKRMLEALRRSEREYRGLFEHAHDPILVFDPNTEEILDANGQACILYDVPREELIGRSLETLTVDAEQGKRLLRKMSEDTGRYSSLESRQYRRDGTIVYVEINAAEVLYRGRKAILSINRNVTARRAAERAVRESEERFRLLLESVTDYAIFMLDPAGNVMSWNEGAQRITGYAADEILRWPISTFYPSEATASADEALRIAAAEGRAVVEGWRIRKDGRRFFAAATLTKIVHENGELRGFSKVIRDITELRQLEQTQQEMFAILQSVAAEWTQTFDAVQVPIVLVDGNGEIRRLNHAAEAMSGRTFPELLRRSVADIPGEPWQTIGRLARYAHDFEKPGETRAVDAGSGSVWQVSSCVSRFDDAERLAIVVAYDLTLVTSLEESLRQTELAATLGNLVGGVAHEVRNPLFTISATLDACEARLGDTPHLSRYIGPLRDEVTRLNHLMADLLEYGKPHPLAIVPAPLARPIAAGVSHCARIAAERGVHIVTAIDEALPDIPIDAARLEQVFLNVVANAVQHSPEGGVVHVRASVAGDAVVCTVTDEGAGLQADEIDRVFMPFYTRRKGGTGLGLSITRKIVVAHGGEIDIANRTSGHGAVVTMRFSRMAAVAAAGASDDEDAIDVGGRRGAPVERAARVFRNGGV